MTYLRLFWEFFKTGLFAVGGGMATVPFLKNIGLATGWYSQTDLMNMLAASTWPPMWASPWRASPERSSPPSVR